MARNLGGISVLVLGLSVAAVGDAGEDEPATPAVRYKALLKEYQVATTGISKDQTNEDRKKVILDKLPLRFLELAEANPQDPIAADALSQVVWVENNTSHPAGGKDSPGGKAMAILLRDHVRSDKLGPVCQRIAFGFRKECETYLRTVLETNRHRDVRALARLSLAQSLSNRSERLDLLQARPDLAERYQDLLGKAYLEELRRQDRAKVAKEAESLLEQAAEQYGNVKVPYGGTVGEEARSELFKIRHLAAGKEAPDIDGEDQDGKQFKLSDYRGKVVLLYFWQQY